jgi:IS30 family transposase
MRPVAGPVKGDDMKKQPNQKHLSLSDRVIIETSLSRELNFTEIASLLSKDPSTISKEIKKHRIIHEGARSSSRSSCRFVQGCNRKNVCDQMCDVVCKRKRDCWCFTRCKFFEMAYCPGILKPPYVCNGCEKKNACRYDKYYYRAKPAYDEYKGLLSSAREGINISKAELERVDALITPLIRAGQPISHVYAKFAGSIPFCSRTFYKHMERGVFSIKNIDLPRKVSYKVRRKHPTKPVDKSYRNDRTYADFTKYMEQHPDTRIVEMDTVIGSGGGVLLTMLFRGIGLMLIFLMPDRKQESVAKVFRELKKGLGSGMFAETFPLFLTDNGTEFMDWPAFLSDDDGVILSEIFFCNPFAAYQKGRIEKNHEYIRMIIPKKKSFKHLTPDKVTLMTNHINSTARPSLNGCSPYELGRKLLPKKLFDLLGLTEIEPNRVVLKPSLLKSL